MKKAALIIIGCISLCVTKAQQRNYSPKDFLRTIDISSPQVSPDGKWVAYTLTKVDTAKDAYTQDIWMVSWDGKDNIQLTATADEDEYTPRFSPDNKYISFLSSRYPEKDEDENDQVWIMDRRGGEAQKLTAVTGEIDDYAWSPDGTMILLTMKDQDFSDTASSEVRKPYVMDRYLFKKDITGYAGNRRTHLYIFHMDSGALDTLTSGNYDESDAAWSPDGKQIAFASNHSTPDPDRNENTDIFIMDAQPGATAKQLSNWPGTEGSPVFSPDGKWVAYMQSTSKKNFTMYGHDVLAVVAANGGTAKLLSVATDRPVMNPRWSKDGKSIYTLMEDDRQQIITKFNVADGKQTRIAEGIKTYWSLELNEANGQWLASMNNPMLPTELYAVENGTDRRLTYVQDEFMAPLKPVTVKGFTSTSTDGTKVSGILYTPQDVQPGTKLPLILYIHGGPVGQDDYEFDLYRNILAAGGFAVAAVNYRGSSGRGVDYITTISADWGHKEVMDIIGAADELVKQGVADVNRMGIGGWSYGGILTDYTIATDNRFKAAASGAGSALQLSMYGVDQYVVQYEDELGPPWKNKDKWIQLSYPFFNADKIKTPTLFMASQKDFNVPVAGAEQMYQALRSMNVPTELVIYPGQYHEIAIPSYMADRFTRYLDWFKKYLQ